MLRTLKLSICNQGTTEGDTTDVGAKIGNCLHHVGGRMGIKMWVLNHVLRNAGENCSQPYKAVEGCHQLR